MRLWHARGTPCGARCAQGAARWLLAAHVHTMTPHTLLARTLFVSHRETEKLHFLCVPAPPGVFLPVQNYGYRTGTLQFLYRCLFTVTCIAPTGTGNKTSSIPVPVGPVKTWSDHACSPPCEQTSFVQRLCEYGSHEGTNGSAARTRGWTASAHAHG